MSDEKHEKAIYEHFKQIKYTKTFVRIREHITQYIVEMTDRELRRGQTWRFKED